MRILLVEDDTQTAGYVSNGLTQEGHNVAVFADGRDALMQILSESWDLLIVDRMLPGMDGLRLVRSARETGCQTPVLFLTTMSGIDDRVTGLNAGGDDYLTKPFAFAELVARVSALGRRPPAAMAETRLRICDLEIDLVSRRVRRGDQLIELQPQEYRLLEYLARHANQVVTRTMLLENVWDFHFDPRTNVVESHISRLRSKLNRGQSRELIHTVRGAGYCLRARS